MSKAHRDKIKALFEKARRRPPEERAAFLEKACDDEAVRREVASLLDVSGEATDYFDRLASAVPSVLYEWQDEKRPAPAAGHDPLGLQGTEVGGYLIESYLGGGGMGIVYRARDLELDRQAALKFLPPFLRAIEEAERRFVREARAASALDHSHIATIYEIGQTEKGRPFLAMAYYEGETLKKTLEREGALPIPKATEYGIQIAKGLGRAHEAGIVHRDIKPANVMVTGRGEVKLLDFGLAKLKGADSLTDTGAALGTTTYMAPEQIRGDEITARSDVFSFGLVLYEMYTGQHPHPGARGEAVAYRLLTEEPEPPSTYRPEGPEQIDEIVLRCLAKEPTERYRSAAEVLRDLQRLQERSPTYAPPEGSTGPPNGTGNAAKTVSWLRSHAGGVAMLIALVVLTGVSYLALVGPGENAAPALDEDRVLVVPFENRTGDDALDPLGRTASDWITEGLSQTDVVEAVPTRTTLQMMGEEGGLRNGLEDRSELIGLAEETDSGVLISGSFIQIGDQVQLQAQIIDAQRKGLVHTLDPVRGPRSEPMAAVEELRQEIMGALSIYVFPGWDIEHLGSPPAYEAYDEYWKGMDHYGFDYETAFEHFERAAKLDPDFVRPQIFMAIGLGNVGQWAEADSVVQAIRRAHDQLSPYDRYYLDWFTYRLEGKQEEALATLFHLEEIAPLDAAVKYQIGHDALRLNRPRQTVETYARMDETVMEHWVDFVAFSWFFGHWADAHHLLGEHKQELETTREAQRYLPKDLDHRANEARALAALGRLDELRAVVEESKAIKPSAGTAGSVMLSAAYELRAHGYRDLSLELAKEAAQWYNEQDHPWSRARALIYAEEWEEAYALLEELTDEEPENVEYLGTKGVVAALMGAVEESQRIEEELREMDRDYLYGEHTYQRARIKALLEERADAVALLEESFDQGKRYGIFVHRDLAFESLKEYEPFQEVLTPKGERL